MTSRCSRCGAELPDNAIHLSRDWPGRLEAVRQAFPGSPVSVCGLAEKHVVAPTETEGL